MSKRRRGGYIVSKRANAGFVGVPCVIRIVPEAPEYESPCFGLDGCTDPDCREWANCEIIEGGKVVGYAYHVSECEMEDLPRTRVRAIARALRAGEAGVRR